MGISPELFTKLEVRTCRSSLGKKLSWVWLGIDLTMTH